MTWTRQREACLLGCFSCVCFFPTLLLSNSLFALACTWHKHGHAAFVIHPTFQLKHSLTTNNFYVRFSKQTICLLSPAYFWVSHSLLARSELDVGYGEEGSTCGEGLQIILSRVAKGEWGRFPKKEEWALAWSVGGWQATYRSMSVGGTITGRHRGHTPVNQLDAQSRSKHLAHTHPMPTSPLF